MKIPANNQVLIRIKAADDMAMQEAGALVTIELTFFSRNDPVAMIISLFDWWMINSVSMLGM